jgi:hypothetical protein
MVVCGHLPRPGLFAPGERSAGTHSSLGGSHRQSGHCREMKNFLLLPGIELQFLGHPARRIRSISTDLTRSEFVAREKRNNLPHKQVWTWCLLFFGAGQTQNQNEISLIQFLYVH